MDEYSHGDIMLAIGRLEGKVDLLVTKIPEHEQRIGALERWRAKMLGIVVAVSLFLSVAGQAMWDRIFTSH